MLSAVIINEDAELNWFFEIGSADFVPGSTVKLCLQLINEEKELRYIPPETAELTLKFLKTDGSELEKAATLIDADDRSLWTVSLTAEESLEIVGGNVLLSLDILGDGTEIKLGVIENAIRRTSLTC